MDVTCDRCSTEYEFEETLVSPRGTTVKCTQCGHLFKVYRLATSLSAQALGSHWTVRRVDGSSHQLPSLADLTRLISEGTFTRDDEVSRTGKVWRRLGDVEELESFFAEADRRGPSRARKTTQGPVLGLAVQKSSPASPAAERSSPRPTEPPANTPARSAPVSSRPSGPIEARQAVSQHTAPTPAPAAVSSEPQSARASEEDEVATEQRPLPARNASSIDPAPSALVASPSNPALAHEPELEPERSPTSSLPAADGPPATRPIEFPDLSDRTELEAPPRSSLWLWLFAVLSTGLAVSTWLLWPMPASQAKRAAIEDPSGQFLARADAAFATHRIEHFEQAITDYIKTLAFHESDAHVLSSLSRVYAAWAQEILFSMQADEREPEKSKPAQRRADWAANSTHVQKLSEQAKLYAETAARKNPGNAEAEVALSDALRLTGNLVAARSELDRARATDRDPSAETLRVAALLTIDEAGGDARAGLSLASQAVAKEPDLVRTQILLARCLVGDGDVQGAQYHLQLITTRDRGHPSALAVEKLIEQRAEPQPARDASAPETVPDASAPQFESLSHEGYISRGQALLEAGQVTTAKRMFEQALFIRPNSSQAHAGLGYVALEKGRPQLAAEHFVAATRVGNDDALIGLGDAYRRMSRSRDALRAYQNYLARNPNGRHASIAQAQIERLSEETARPKKAP
jgi:predicted Zn finger-like uncharacterized protein